MVLYCVCMGAFETACANAPVPAEHVLKKADV